MLSCGRIPRRLMKKSRIACVIAAMVFVSTVVAVPAFAASGDNATISMLTSGDWKVEGKGWSDVYTFNPDKTVTRHYHPPKETITWSIDNNKVTIHYADHEQLLYLPLDPNGTKGLITKGNHPFTATRL